MDRAPLDDLFWASFLPGGSVDFFAPGSSTRTSVLDNLYRTCTCMAHVGTGHCIPHMQQHSLREYQTRHTECDAARSVSDMG
eukprot:2151483-Rhodomonas_salina.2